VVELHEECAASIPDCMHQYLHVVGFAADRGDALQYHSEFLNAVAHFFIKIAVPLVTIRLEFVLLHLGFNE
jgi:hypothetical protein